MVRDIKKIKSRELYCKELGWKIIFHYIGYFAALSPIYWIIQYSVYKSRQEKEFFSLSYYDINYKFGIFMVGVLIINIIFSII